tara:strand:- start:181 stop:1383 length:1203 start_codon:yes stop_codon:yes gene_type:complete
MKFPYQSFLKVGCRNLIGKLTFPWGSFLIYLAFQTGCEFTIPKSPPDIFYRNITLKVADGPSDVLAKDLNLDGNMDLAIANMRADLVTIYQGEGDGFFSKRMDLKVLPEPSSVVSGDLNRDGFPDLILNSRGSDALSILISSGDGFFRPVKQVKTGKVPLDIILADINRDGFLDAAVTLTFHKLEIFLGFGNGNFRKVGTYTTGSRSESGVSADFNEDGSLDLALAVSSPGASSVRIFEGNGDGTFNQTRRLAKGQKPLTLFSKDMNGDHHVDLLAATGMQDNMILMLGKGNGDFYEPTNFSGGGGPLALTANFFNRDTFPDVAVANSRSSSFSIIFGKSGGKFHYPSLDYIVDGGTPIAIASADFNNDGMLDIAVSSDTKNTIEVYLQKLERKLPNTTN